MTAAVYLPDEPSMLAAGERLAPLLSPWLNGGAPDGGAPDGGAMVFLYGSLGAGKTTLVRGLLRAFGVKGAVRSPTYTLIEPYEIQAGNVLRRIFHLDLYRLGDPGELDYLGWEELLAEGGLMLIEWPERGAGVLPVADLRFDIEVQHSGRLLSLAGCGDWQNVANAAMRALSTA